MEKLTIFTDGGARGNPGPAGIGVVVYSGKIIKEISKYIGEATNNQAEYAALIEALNYIIENIDTEGKEIEFMLDSELVVQQLNGKYKVKNEGLKPLYDDVQTLLLDLNQKPTFTHVRREKNQEADKLVNFALDKQMKGDS